MSKPDKPKYVKDLADLHQLLKETEENHFDRKKIQTNPIKSTQDDNTGNDKQST